MTDLSLFMFWLVITKVDQCYTDNNEQIFLKIVFSKKEDISYRIVETSVYLATCVPVWNSSEIHSQLTRPSGIRVSTLDLGSSALPVNHTGFVGDQ